MKLKAMLLKDWPVGKKISISHSTWENVRDALESYRTENKELAAESLRNGKAYLNAKSKLKRVLKDNCECGSMQVGQMCGVCESIMAEDPYHGLISEFEKAHKLEWDKMKTKIGALEMEKSVLNDTIDELKLALQAAKDREILQRNSQ